MPQPPEIPLVGFISGDGDIADLPGQVTWDDVLTQRWRRRGGDLVGARPEVSSDVAAHIHALARAEGRRLLAEGWDPKRFRSDARAEAEQTAELVALGPALRVMAEAERELLLAGKARAAEPEPNGQGGTVMLGLATLCALAGGVVFLPTAQLLFGGALSSAVPDGMAGPVALLLSLALGLLFPAAAWQTALARRGYASFAGAVAIEIAILTLLAWARASALVPDGFADDLAMASSAYGRTWMMLAIESLTAVVSNIAGADLAATLRAGDRRRRLLDEEQVARDRLAGSVATLAGIEARVAAARQRELARDRAAADAERREALVRLAATEGAMMQAQANWELLEGAPQAAMVGGGLVRTVQ